MTTKKILHVVHCIDTEGPLDETLSATFERLESIFGIKLPPTTENLNLLQNKSVDLGGLEDEVARCFVPKLLKYNSNWLEIEEMLDEMLSNEFREKCIDDFDGGWVYSWHCMDHIGYVDNPRHKDVGYGNIFNFYKKKLMDSDSIKDEINWHFHPLSLTKNPTHAATSYVNSYELLTQILCRRVIEDHWFPVVNRPGFHAERPDSHLFLEQWIPFDYANQSYDEVEEQPDMIHGRFGDWVRAPRTWRGYHPSHDDYQLEGACRRIIFRCLNVGTRIRSLTISHIQEAFKEARNSQSAIVAFANHDYRDMRTDVLGVMGMLEQVRKDFPDVSIKFSGAEDAAIALLGYKEKPQLQLKLQLIDNRLIVAVMSGEVFGPQPFLAIKTRDGKYYHDNFDVLIPQKKWCYTFDEQTIKIDALERVGVGSAGKYGKYAIKILNLSVESKKNN